MSQIFGGEHPCQGKYKDGRDCKEMCYYVQNGALFCGRHSSEGRAALKKNPNAADVREKAKLENIVEIHAVAKNNREAGKKGRVTASKLLMFKQHNFKPQAGFIPIFPNNKHSHAFGWGFGDFSSLSPMRLGPVVSETGTFIAKNIENAHQFAKVFPSELSEEQCNCPAANEFRHFKPNKKFYETRDAGYQDDIPHRHKFDVSKIQSQNKKFESEMTDEPTLKKSRKTASELKNSPVYSVCLVGSQEIHVKYVECRYFYCHHFQKLGMLTPAFKQLKHLMNEGYNLEIVGYDAYKEDGIDATTLFKHYCDPKRPFGHEMVVLALLAIEDSENYPWNVYFKKYKHIYCGEQTV